MELLLMNLILHYCYLLPIPWNGEYFVGVCAISLFSRQFSISWHSDSRNNIVAHTKPNKYYLSPVTNFVQCLALDTEKRPVRCLIKFFGYYHFFSIAQNIFRNNLIIIYNTCTKQYGLPCVCVCVW